jgi:hypothetical protein
MPKVPDISRVAAKWSTNSGNATPSYVEGVQNPKEDWKTATLAGAENYKIAVTKAANDGRFAKGVNRTTSDKQIQASVQKGQERFGQGIALAGPDYAEGMAPVLAVTAATQLPPKKPKGDPSNINRVAVLAAAQHAAKQRR